MHRRAHKLSKAGHEAAGVTTNSLSARSLVHCASAYACSRPPGRRSVVRARRVRAFNNLEHREKQAMYFESIQATLPDHLEVMTLSRHCETGCQWLSFLKILLSEPLAHKKFGTAASVGSAYQLLGTVVNTAAISSVASSSRPAKLKPIHPKPAPTSSASHPLLHLRTVGERILTSTLLNLFLGLGDRQSAAGCERPGCDAGSARGIISLERMLCLKSGVLLRYTYLMLRVIPINMMVPGRRYMDWQSGCRIPVHIVLVSNPLSNDMDS